MRRARERNFVVVAVLAIGAYLLSRGKKKVSGADVLTHWYGPEISDGAFRDLLDSLRQDKNLTTAGAPPIVTCKLTVVTRDADVDVTFALVHDVEGEVRATILDRATLSLDDVWMRIDRAINEGLS